MKAGFKAGVSFGTGFWKQKAAKHSIHGMYCGLLRVNNISIKPQVSIIINEICKQYRCSWISRKCKVNCEREKYIAVRGLGKIGVRNEELEIC